MTDQYDQSGPEDEPEVAKAKGKDPKAKKKKTGGAFVDPDVADCPAIPLGYEGARVIFALPEGELRSELASKIGGMLKTDIFVSVAGQAFLANWRSGDDDSLQLQAAAIWFNRRCREAGKWDRNRPVRGYGVWPGADGPILHVGDAIGRWPFKDKDWTSIADALRAGGRGPVWKLAPSNPRPGKPATVADGEKLRAALDRWNFADLERDGYSEADVLLGWQGAGLLGAVAPFRPHVLLSGGAGAGKTTLSRFMQAVGSANAGDLLDSFSEAGLRNSLAGEARALYLDEAEPSPDGNGPVEKALEVLRRMSTGDGSNRRGGDIGGAVVGQSAVGSAYLASIMPVPLGDAMSTRVVEIRLRPLGKAKGGADEVLATERAWAAEMSPAFLARAIRDAGRYRSDVSLLKGALGKNGQDPRAADLVAALAAGRRLLLHDEALTEETAEAEIQRWAPLIRGREETSSAQNPGQACLAKILGINSGQHERNRYLTIGEMVQDEVEGPGFHEKVLKSFGLRVENNYPGHDRPGPWLLVSTNHEALARALRGTPYANWKSVLEQLADLGDKYAPKHVSSAVRFGMHQSRAIAVPLTPWLEGPVSVGADRREATAFDEPNWDTRFGPTSRFPSRREDQDG